MNTFRILSLITLVGISTAQIRPMDSSMNFADLPVLEDAPEIVTEVTQEVTQSLLENLPLEDASKITQEVAPAAKGVLKQITDTSDTVYHFTTDHPYYTAAGVVAIAVIGKASYFVYQNGIITPAKEFYAKHPKLSKTALATILLAGAGLTYLADQKGLISFSAVNKENATAVGNYLYNSLPSKETVMSHLNTKPAIATGLAVTAASGYGAYNYYKNKGKTPVPANSQPEQTVGGSTSASTSNEIVQSDNTESNQGYFAKAWNSVPNMPFVKKAEPTVPTEDKQTEKAAVVNTEEKTETPKKGYLAKAWEFVPNMRFGKAVPTKDKQLEEKKAKVEKTSAPVSVEALEETVGRLIKQRQPNEALVILTQLKELNPGNHYSAFTNRIKNLTS